MKKIIIALSTVLGSMAGIAAAENPEMNIETAVIQGPQFVQKTDIIQNTKEKELIRIKVDYIVDENGKNYVVYIQSNRPDIHERVIRMVESMPAQQGTEFKKNNIVIEYEL
jgi:low affinity Fe/Cu permease